MLMMRIRRTSFLAGQQMQEAEGEQSALDALDARVVVGQAQHRPYAATVDLGDQGQIRD